MTREIKDLQKLIEERAVNRLNDDIQKMYEVIRNMPLFQTLPSNLYIKEVKEGSHSADPKDFFYWSRSYMTALKAHWLPIYIERESVKFLKDMEDLKTRTDGIQEEVNNLLDNQFS